MQRLREQTSSADPVAARAAALLSAMPALDADDFETRPLSIPRVRERRPLGRIRAVLALAITLGSVGAAAATFHRVSWPDGKRVTLSAAPAPAALRSRAAAATGAGPVGPALAPSPGDLSTAEERLEPAVPAHELGSVAMARPAVRGPVHVREAPKAKAVAAAGDDASLLIVEGLRALRREGDAARAQALAEEALRRYPHGTQTEEAMALAMEAASARVDASGARRAAERYLASFPSGRFADRAQRILAPSPK